MFSCALCENETCYWQNLCPSCRKVKHYMSCFSRDRVVDVLDQVLARSEEKQDLKIELEIRKEIAKKEHDLNKKKKAKFQLPAKVIE